MKGKEKTEVVVRLNMLLAATNVQVIWEGGKHPALLRPKSGGNLMVINVKEVELALAKLINKLLAVNKKDGLLKWNDDIPIVFSL